MTTPDPQATPFTPEDPAKVTVPEVPSADFSIPDAPAVEDAAQIPAPEVPTFEPAAEVPAPEVPTFEPAAQIPAPEVPTFEPAAEVPAPEAPSFPQASAPSFDETMATPGSTTYGTAYDAASTQPGPDAAANQAPYGAQTGFAQPGFEQAGFEQAAYAAGQQAYGQPGYSQPAYGQPVVAGPPKQWLVALLLGLFFGGFGVHNFYLGYTNRAIIQLILTIIVIGAPVTAVWVLIELIMILMRSGSYGYDAQGQPLQ
ncbi:MAG: NINE protein [Actinomyces sp.]|nr:NINE protein [Actinomyces sp.]